MNAEQAAILETMEESRPQHSMMASRTVLTFLPALVMMPRIKRRERGTLVTAQVRPKLASIKKALWFWKPASAAAGVSTQPQIYISGMTSMHSTPMGRPPVSIQTMVASSRPSELRPAAVKVSEVGIKNIATRIRIKSAKPILFFTDLVSFALAIYFSSLSLECISNDSIKDRGFQTMRSGLPRFPAGPFRLLPFRPYSQAGCS